MVRSFRRGVRARVALSAVLLASTSLGSAGCVEQTRGPTPASPISGGDFAKWFFASRLREEYQVRQVCGSLEAGASSSASPALTAAIEVRRTHARTLVCLAVHGTSSPTCSTLEHLDLAALEKGAPRGDSRAMAVLASVRTSVTPDRGDLALTDALDRVNLSRAAVIGLVHLANDLQDQSNRIAILFGFLQGLFEPLVSRLSGEFLAASMDGALDMVEDTFKLPRASLSAEACRVYEAMPPRSTVARSLVKRAILRYTPDRTAVAASVLQGCSTLLKSSSPNVDVCARMVVSVFPTPPGAAPQSVAELAAPPELPTDVPIDRTHLDAQAGALREAALGCQALREAQRGGECGLERVARVAGVLHERSEMGPQVKLGEGVEQPGDKERAASRFDDAERALLAIESNLRVLRGDVQAIAQDVATIRDEHHRERAALEGVIKEQNDELRATREQLSTLAARACKDQLQAAISARNELARELGLGKQGERFCEAKLDDAVVHSASGVVSASRAAFCNPFAPVSVKVHMPLDFDACRHAVDCAKQPDLCRSLRAVGARVDGADDIDVHGYSDARPVVTCAAEATTAYHEGVRSGARLVTRKPKSDEAMRHLGLSLLRARSVALLLAKPGSSKAPNLVAHGADVARGDCVTEACFREDRRVEITLKSLGGRPLDISSVCGR